jgi:hypothetical protein
MRRTATAAIVLTLAMAVLLVAPAPAAPSSSGLFGAWIGGIYPPPVTLNAQECLAQPMVIFTNGVVMRAIMTSPAYAQRLIDNAVTTANGYQVQLVPRQSAADVTFGCPNPNVLPVQWRGDNEITFPGCTDFPFPLIRCVTR